MGANSDNWSLKTDIAIELTGTKMQVQKRC